MAIDLHRSISVVLDRLDLDLPSPHPSGCGTQYQQTVAGYGGSYGGVDSRMTVADGSIVSYRVRG